MKSYSGMRARKWVKIKVLPSSIGSGTLIRKQNTGENQITLGIDLTMSMRERDREKKKKLKPFC